MLASSRHVQRPLEVTTSDPATWWQVMPGGIHLYVRVVPGAKKSEIAEVRDTTIRLRLNAPAVEGKANAELVRFIAKWCATRPNKVHVVSGDHSRVKTVFVEGLYCPPDTTMF